MKSVKAFIILSSTFLLLLNFFRYLVKISYANFSQASYCAIVIGLCLSAIAIVNLGKKSLFNAVFLGGYIMCNFLFINILFAGDWASALVSEIKWLFILFQFIYVLLFASRRLYYRTKEDDFLFNIVDKFRNIYTK